MNDNYHTTSTTNKKLTLLLRFVDKVCGKCPGSFNVSNWETNSTDLYEPWHSDFITNDYGLCTAPQSFCHYNGLDAAFNNCKLPFKSTFSWKWVNLMAFEWRFRVIYTPICICNVCLSILKRLKGF